VRVSIEDINAFHRFAVRRIQEAGLQPLTMHDLLSIHQLKPKSPTN